MALISLEIPGLICMIVRDPLCMLTATTTLTGQYLKDLRTNRPVRPSGSRPLPTKNGSSSSLSPHKDMPLRASSSLSMTRPSPTRSNASDIFPRSNSALSHRRMGSQVSLQSGSQEPNSPELSRTLSPTPSSRSHTSRYGTYRESSQRWLQRQEVRSIRNAMEVMDLQDDDKNLHSAAQDEATDLVMQHQKYGFAEKNPHSPYRNPDARTPNRFGFNTETGRHARSQSGSSGSGSSNGSLHGYEIRGPSASQNERNSSTQENASGLPAAKSGTLRKTHKVDFGIPATQTSPSRSRRISSGSSKGIFKNPADCIYEEPEDSDVKVESNTPRRSSPVLTTKPRNSLPRPSRPWRTSLIASAKERFSAYHTNKSPTSPPHKPVYQSNSFSSPTTSVQDTPTKDGLEIRSDDIRAATSRRLGDRSSKLPTPSAVSDRPGRPIVSFEPGWKAPDDEPESQPSIEIHAPESDSTKSVSCPAVPTISVSADDDPTPAISISGPAESLPNVKPSARPLPTPTPSQGSARTSNGHRSFFKDKSIEIRGPPSFRTGVPAASCDACSLPISGRIVTASKSRLHPECFTCYHCNTGLECVAFFEEPAAKKGERLASAETSEADSQMPRFYCHLDFHELFSPRCKHCKTPIEGEVIVACGAQYHQGHFFCAECGDPFTSSTPFVERNGYAWCLKCHSRRTASKCQACKLPVMEDSVITALGGEWHEKCFVCHECSGGFGPDGRFFAHEGPPRFTAKGRQIGGPVQKAICEACESRRLKA